MENEELNERLTEVSVSASKKVQLEQYSPIEEYVQLTAEVQEGDDPDEILDALEERVWDQVEEGVAERYETHVRKEDE